MKKKNCCIYTRVSTSMQVDGFSLDAQKEKLKNMQSFRSFQSLVNTLMKESPAKA